MKQFSIHKIPSLLLAALFACGILAGNHLRLPAEVLLVLSTAVFSASLFMFLRGRSDKHPNLLLTVSLSVLIVTMGAVKISVDSDSQAGLGSDKNKSTTVIGRVQDAVSTFENKTRFLLRLEQVPDLGTALPERALVFVTVVRQRRDSTGLTLAHGCLVNLKGELYRPSEERNPGEFNSRVYYEAQGIRFLMRVRGHSRVTVIDPHYRITAYDGLMRHVILPVRSYILDLIDQTIGDGEGELLKGLLIGERAGIPYATRVAFTNSGISHVLAVSGSNVIVVVGFFMTLCSLLHFSRTIRIVLVCVAVVCYMLLTGSQPPIVRATVMTIVVLVGKLLGERTTAFNSLGVAALLILIYDARQLFDVGFQLSFAAVFSIIYLYPIANSWISKLSGDALWRRAAMGILRVCAVSLVATLGTLPLTAVYFGRVSVVGIITNIFIIPLVAGSVTLGFVSSLVGWCSLWVAGVFSAANQQLLMASLYIAKLSGSRSWAYLDTLRFSPIYSLPFYLALALVFHFNVRPVARKLLILLIVAFNIAAFTPSPGLDERSDGLLRVSFIDVGQGDAAFIEFPDGKTMLIDAGMRNAEYDTGERNVVPFLKRRGISTLNYVLASHPDGDHIGGMPAVLRECVVGEVIESGQSSTDPVYDDYRRAVRTEGCSSCVARADSFMMSVGGVRVYALHPQRIVPFGDTTNGALNLNNMSVVLKLCYGETSFLFAGDAEREAEGEMLSRYGRFLHSTVLKVGHHGSRTSSSDEFARTVRPQFAVVSVGLHNKFGHPSDEVMERLRSLDVEVLRTDEEGAIIFQSDGTTVNRVEWR